MRRHTLRPPIPGRRLLVPLLLLLPGGAAAPTAASPPPAPDVDFNREVRPLLSDRCFKCHGPDDKQRQARLRLDIREGAFSGSVVVPGKPLESELYRRITAEDEDDRMPPADSGKTLSAEEIDLLGRWIEEGAPWQEHWAFLPPRRPDLPEVRLQEWVRNPIDRFVLARLEAEGLEPQPEADRYTLIRRVTLDLTGLPPAPEEVAAFAADSDPNAYEKVAGRLLASPRYGEHMARHWLDAARYGDTHGLHLDNLRTMWPYRDWVIRANNAGMPFDRFTVEQLAGDLLPEAGLDQRIATGFNRCNVTTSEGGAIDEEFLVRYAVDRVATTCTVWMGLTAGCATCHEHKFDPISQKEFYQLFAYFNNITEPAMDGNNAEVPPFVRVPLPGTEEERAEVAVRIQEVEARRRARAELSAVRQAFAAWLAAAEARPETQLAAPPGLAVHYPLDEREGAVASAVAGPPPGAVKGAVARVEGKMGGALRFDGGLVDLGGAGDFEWNQEFSYSAWVRTPGNITGTPLARMDTQASFRGWDLYVTNRRVAAHLIHHWSDVALKVTTREDVLEPGRWHHLAVTCDGSGKAGGLGIYVDGKPREVEVNNDSLAGKTIRTQVPLQLGQRRGDSNFKGGEVDDVRLYGRQLAPPEVAALAGADPIAPILAMPRGERTPEQVRLLEEHYLGGHDEPYQKLTAELAGLRAREKELSSLTAATLVMEERETPRGAYVLYRGQYDQRREKVEPGTPAFLPPLAAAAPPNRLGFARWLVAPDHPLTARVCVNRLWQQKFGIGLVRTQEDFGSQGEPPSHPELLDWLATELVRTGWDLKALHRLMVTSATYRQSSRASGELLRRDPENRLLARGPRFRLDAEVLRDQALAASGLLVSTIGGPSVKPPQPPGLWYAVGYTSSNTARFQQDQGEKIYRRSLYTFWKRTASPPVMTAFDAPSREACTVRRERTNTPLQALVLMNEPQFVECARHLAQRILREGPATPEVRATCLFERVAARPPRPDEVVELVEAYRWHLADFRRRPEAARELIQVGDSEPDAALDPAELAAWTMVGNLALNLDEVISKG